VKSLLKMICTLTIIACIFSCQKKEEPKHNLTKVEALQIEHDNFNLANSEYYTLLSIKYDIAAPSVKGILFTYDKEHGSNSSRDFDKLYDNIDKTIGVLSVQYGIPNKTIAAMVLDWKLLSKQISCPGEE